MKFFKTFMISIFLAFRSLRNNLARTFLSLLGIMIGVVALSLVFSLGSGLKDFVLGQIESFGSDLIEVEIKVPNTKQTSSENAGGITQGIQITTLKISDLEELGKIENIKNWYGGLIGQKMASYRNKNESAMIFGTTAGVVDVDDQFKIISGETFSEKDDNNLQQVVVLGSGMKEKLFGKTEAVGKKIKIGDNYFQVIGILEERGSNGFFDFDDLIYMPVQTLQKKILGVDYVQFGFYKIADDKRIEETEIFMNQRMRDLHDIEDPEDDDFAIMSIAEATDMVKDVFLIINILLVSLTMISLIVGGVGIMNVMYVSVAERFFEIGLRKALGARNADILWQFLVEAIFITLLGGFLGLFLGFIFSKLAEYIISFYGFYLNFSFSSESIFFSLVFSLLTGIIFGIKPAWNASKLSPMETLIRQ